MADHVRSDDQIRTAVRERYAAAATKAAHGEHEAAREAEASGCGSSGGGGCQGDAFGADLYGDGAAAGATESAVAASLGCGVPTAVADLHEGETVLDLGSGGGADVLISARRVGPSGRAVGVDMTDEMLELARSNARDAGAENVDFLKGHIEALPLPDASVDVVISNCVINLAADKPRALRETARVLRAGGRLAISDVVADPDMAEGTRADIEQWTGCVAGALTRGEYEAELRAAGFADVEVRETHRVHEHAGSAIVRALKPLPAAP